MSLITCECPNDDEDINIITKKDEKNAECESCGEIGEVNHNFWLVLEGLAKGDRKCYGLCGTCDPPEEEEEELK